MSVAAQACALVADLLKVGPRNAAEILATAEGAKISVRTLQRAATALGVAKTRAAFRGGWIWALPAEDAKTESGFREECAVGEMSNDVHVSSSSDNKVSTRDRAEIIAARLRKLEAGRGMKAPIYAQDPRLLQWVKAGISDPQLREAYELAVYALESEKSQAPLTAGFLDRYIGKVI